ncbi:hypothetical protein VNO78_18492 [Psophocarpus tetragonolobus]|uniref:NADP-dependent oxidoreductase domain-containing protein n=1 Tax=Psophocarpus tetragonolobus TaxID=3891 RepID=A0AAN9SKP7_PSOTE
MAKMQIERVDLGTQGFEVSKLGFGCMNLTGPYTAALKQLPREKIQIATKFGIAIRSVMQIKGSPEYVLLCCEASLKRLDVEYIDLYYQHRVDQTLGIGIVPYSPFGRSFFGGRGVVENVPATSSLKAHARFQAENLDKNKNIYERIESLAKKHQATPAQLALAWVLQQGEDVVPIPGTTKIKNLDQNIGGLAVKVSEKNRREICEAVPIGDVAGARCPDGMERFTWKNANTPPKDSRIST